MRLIRGQHNLHHAVRGGSVTIGNFDGVHRGHQAMVAQLQAKGPGPHTVLSFEPMPSEYFAPDEAPPRLSSLREKFTALATLQVDQCLIVRFDAGLAHLKPSEFVQRLLLDGLGVKRVLVGDDFRYGAGRAGDIETLRKDGQRNGFEVEALNTVKHDGARISSSRVREALSQGEVAEANVLLGRSYNITGRVRRGQGKGAGLGFATANLLVQRKPAPQFGVYATHLCLADGRRLPAVSNLGVRPSIAGSTGCWLETHVLDFDGDLYSRRVSVEFEAFVRPELRFDGLDALTAQIARDVAAARAAHAAAG